MRQEPNWFSESMAWFCCALMATMLFGIAVALVAGAIFMVMTFGASAVGSLLVISAMTYGIRRYAW